MPETCQHLNWSELISNLNEVINSRRDTSTKPNTEMNAEIKRSVSSICPTKEVRCSITRDLSSMSDECDNFLGYEWLDLLQRCEKTIPKLMSKYLARPSSKSHQNNTLKVPNIVHYVWFGKHNFIFLNYISFLSVEKHLEPEYIFMHGDTIPSGRWWNETMRHVHNVVYVYRTRQLSIHGTNISHIEHSADIARFQIMQGEWDLENISHCYIVHMQCKLTERPTPVSCQNDAFREVGLSDRFYINIYICNRGFRIKSILPIFCSAFWGFCDFVYYYFYF